VFHNRSEEGWWQNLCCNQLIKMRDTDAIKETLPKQPGWANTFDSAICTSGKYKGNQDRCISRCNWHSNTMGSWKVKVYKVSACVLLMYFPHLKYELFNLELWLDLLFHRNEQWCAHAHWMLRINHTNFSAAHSLHYEVGF